MCHKNQGAKLSKLLRKIFGRIFCPKKVCKFLKLLWKLLRKNLGKYVGKH